VVLNKLDSLAVIIKTANTANKAHATYIIAAQIINKDLLY
jgi:hypothetical protein